MNFNSGFLYAGQAEAEEAAARFRGQQLGLIEVLEELNESLDSVRLANLIAHRKFDLGL